MENIVTVLSSLLKRSLKKMGYHRLDKAYTLQWEDHLFLSTSTIKHMQYCSLNLVLQPCHTLSILNGEMYNTKQTPFQRHFHKEKIFYSKIS